MAFGASILNPTGYVQLDDSYSNFQIVEVIYVTPTFLSWINAAGTVPIYAYGLTVSSSDLIFVRLDNHSGFVGYQAGYVYSYPGTNLTILSTSSAQLTVVKCRGASSLASPTSGYGINVYNSAGGLTFSSLYNNVSIVAAATYDNSNFYYDSSNSQTLSTPQLTAGYGRYMLLNYLSTVSAMQVYSENGFPPDILFNVMAQYANTYTINLKSVPNRAVYPDFYGNFPGTITAMIGDII